MAEARQLIARRVIPFVATLAVAACGATPRQHQQAAGITDSHHEEIAPLPAWADRWWRVVNGQFGYLVERGATFPPQDALLRLSREELTFSRETPVGVTFNRQRHRLVRSSDAVCAWSDGIEVRQTSADLAELSFPMFVDGKERRSFLVLRALEEPLARELDRKNALQRPPADSCARAQACCRADAVGGRRLCPGPDATSPETCATFLSDTRLMMQREHLTAPAECGP